MQNFKKGPKSKTFYKPKLKKRGCSHHHGTYSNSPNSVKIKSMVDQTIGKKMGHEVKEDFKVDLVE